MEPIERIASFLAGTCSQQEAKELEAWRKEAVANEKEFCRFKKMWEATGATKNFCPDVNQAWQKVQTCIFQKDTSSPSPKQQLSIPLYRKPWAIAAAVALFILGAGIFMVLKQNTAFDTGSTLASLETGENEKQEIILADGSRVWLNQNSRITYPESFEGKNREVKLEGEGYFEVAHIPEKPFIIQAGKGKVQVLGTAFNLEVKDQVKVQVAGGRVKFSANDMLSTNALVLEAGDAALLDDDKLIKSAQDPNFLAWKTGEFIFEDSQLAEVLIALEKYYHIKFTASSEISKCRVFVQFKQQPIEEVLRVLSLTLQLNHDYSAGTREVTFTAQNPAKGCFTTNP